MCIRAMRPNQSAGSEAGKGGLVGNLSHPACSRVIPSAKRLSTLKKLCQSGSIWANTAASPPSAAHNHAARKLGNSA